MKPALVVLAAGASRRLGRCKALVEVAGETILARLLHAGRSLNEVPPLVISGAHHDRIAAATPNNVEVVRNETWELGRTGSVRTARDARAGHALVIAPVDVPLVPEAVFRSLSDAWTRAGEPPLGWLAPRVLNGNLAQFGHPVVIGPALLEKLSDFADDTPLSHLRT